MKRTFREEIIDDIFKFSNELNSFELIENKYKSVSKNTIIKELIQVGIMPEVFEHDSSEEKLWSKFSDVILSKALDCIGLQSEVLRTRGNSADVYSRAKNYTLVSDAKCFRLSRTAKNQKDFKVFIVPSTGLPEIFFPIFSLSSSIKPITLIFNSLCFLISLISSSPAIYFKEL